MAEKTPQRDDLDFLLTEDGESITQEGIAGWRVDPNTVHAVRKLRGRYQALAKSLIGGAEGSSDPRVAALGGRLRELGAVVLAMGGKTL